MAERFDIAVARRQKKALQLRAAGLSQCEIASELGIGQPATSRLLARAEKNTAAVIESASRRTPLNLETVGQLLGLHQ